MTSHQEWCGIREGYMICQKGSTQLAHHQNHIWNHYIPRTSSHGVSHVSSRKMIKTYQNPPKYEGESGGVHIWSIWASIKIKIIESYQTKMDLALHSLTKLVLCCKKISLRLGLNPVESFDFCCPTPAENNSKTLFPQLKPPWHRSPECDSSDPKKDSDMERQNLISMELDGTWICLFWWTSRTTRKREQHQIQEKRPMKDRGWFSWVYIKSRVFVQTHLITVVTMLFPGAMRSCKCREIPSIRGSKWMIR